MFLPIAYVICVLCYVSVAHPYNKVGDGPEGPEARSTADKLHANVTGMCITSAVFADDFKGEGFVNMRLPALIHNVHARGKKVIFELDNDYILVTSLGMTGRWCYDNPKHARLTLHCAKVQCLGVMRVLSSHMKLYYDDTRGFGNVSAVPRVYTDLYFKDLGPDVLEHALTTPITATDWLNILCVKKNRNKKICDILTDQSMVAGIGWYLQTDILYYAGVHPLRTGASITNEEWERIRSIAHDVIKLSYAYGGLTIESFINPDGTLGSYPAAIYGKQCDALNNVVQHQKIGTRTVHWVSEIQH